MTTTPHARLALAATLGLVLLAGCAVAAWHQAGVAVDRQATAAREVDVAGRQRMLSQRILAQATLVADGADPAALVAATDQLASAHAALRDGSERRGIRDERDAAVARAYDADLDRLVGEFVAAARTAAAGDVDAVDRLARLEPTLLAELEGAVASWRQQADDGIGAVGRVQDVVLVASLVSLAAVALLVLRPAIRRIGADHRRLGAERAALEDTVTRERTNARALAEAASTAEVVAELRRIVAESIGDRSAQLLLAADADERMRTVLALPDDGSAAAGSSCTVTDPARCVALRTGRTWRSGPGAEGFEPCPHATGRLGATARARCIPVVFTGDSSGALHLVADGETDADQDLGLLASAFGQATTRLVSITRASRSGDDAGSSSPPAPATLSG